MISATHAHTGPVLAGRGLRDDALGAGNDLVRRYTSTLPAKIAEAVRRAESRSGTGHRQGGQGQGAFARVQPPVPHDRRHRRLEPRQAQPQDPQARRPHRPRGRRRPVRVGRGGSQAAGDLRQLRGPSRQYRRAQVLGRHARNLIFAAGHGQGPGDGYGLYDRLLRRHQPHQRELGRAPARLRERGTDGNHPRRRGAPDMARA